MKFRTNLLFRGVFLVAFPVICQILIVFVVLSALEDVERKLEREAQSGQTMFLGGLLFTEVADAFFSLGIAFGVDGNCFKTFQKAMDSQRPKFNNFVAEIRKGVRNQEQAGSRKEPGSREEPGAQEQPRNKKMFSKQEKFRNQELVNDLTSTWNVLMADTNPGGFLKLDLIVDSNLTRAGSAFLSKLQELVSSMEVANDREIQATQESIEKLQSLLMAAVAISLLVSLALWYLYSISIEKPLLLLIENGRRLSQGAPLLPSVGGAIELSRLNQVMLEVSKSVDESVSKEREAISNAADLICSIDEEAVFINVNPVVEHLLGYDQEEMIGRNLHEFIEPGSDFDLVRTVGEAIRTGTTYEFQVRLRRRDTHWVDTRWSCLYSPTHDSLFCVVQDISEEIRVQQLKEDFSQTVSEELRIPLGQLQNSLNELLSGGRGAVPDKIIPVLDRSRQNVHRLLLLANDLLDFQRLRGTQLSLNIATHDLSSIIKEAHDCVSSLASSKEIEIVLPVESIMIPCDKMRMLQTLANLISNAIKFSPHGSKIEVQLSRSEKELTVAVIDSGPGIPAKDRERIFQAFEQVSSAHAKQGTGLGLAICKMFVEAHGGTIKAVCTDSETGDVVTFSDGAIAGTAFMISLRS